LPYQFELIERITHIAWRVGSDFDPTFFGEHVRFVYTFFGEHVRFVYTFFGEHVRFVYTFFGELR
jgi:hypothetical protein